jgi:DNA polymerase delta subunit 1
MPAAKVKDIQPTKRVLVDAPSSRQNIQTDTPSKRRKLNGQSKNFKTPGGPGSGQVKSQFEEEVLEKLTQDLDDLKQHNAEKDQQWARPSLDGFDETRDSLCFQQIDAEEGTLHGGKTCVKLFGVTEVSYARNTHAAARG